jgi:hypothetical protein
MKRRTLLFISCSPRRHTGVSTTACLLTDFYLSRKMNIEGFDIDPQQPRYASLFPECVHIADLADIRAQIFLFESILVNNNVPKVIDLCYRSYEHFFMTAERIGFVEEARRRGIEPVILFHVDAADKTLTYALKLSVFWGNVIMFLVHNEGTAPVDACPKETLSRYPTRAKITIARLEAPVARVLDLPTLSLSSFLGAPPTDMPIAFRDALGAWLDSVFTQFHGFDSIETSALRQLEFTCEGCDLVEYATLPAVLVANFMLKGWVAHRAIVYENGLPAYEISADLCPECRKKMRQAITPSKWPRLAISARN